MKVLVFDTETTGLPKSWKTTGIKWFNNWPYIVQFSWIFVEIDDKVKVIDTKDYIIKMEGNVVIPQESTKIHGITHEMSLNNGVSFQEALDAFFMHLEKTDYLVAHNISFDKNVLTAEMMRRGIVNLFDLHHFIEYDTLKYGDVLTNLTRKCWKTGKIRKKYPKLVELHDYLFPHEKNTLNNLHNSLNDVLVCLRCFYKMLWDGDILDRNRYLKKIFISNL